MSALGFMVFGFGLLTIWSALQRVSVFDVLRSILGAQTIPKDEYGKVKGTTA